MTALYAVAATAIQALVEYGGAIGIVGSLRATTRRLTTLAADNPLVVGGALLALILLWFIVAPKPR